MITKIYKVLLVVLVGLLVVPITGKTLNKRTQKVPLDSATYKQVVEPPMTRLFIPQPPSPLKLINVNYTRGNNTFEAQEIDKSRNGYGMISFSTRPLGIGLNDSGRQDDVVVASYRQHAGINSQISGQVGGSISTDGASVWRKVVNLNESNTIFANTTMRFGRYPSVVFDNSLNIACFFWNEYSSSWSTPPAGVDPTGEDGYGGYPLYSCGDALSQNLSEEFKSSESLSVDGSWISTFDLWVGSVDLSHNNGNPVYNITFSDWTRRGIYLYHAENRYETYIDFTPSTAQTTPIIDEINDLVAGDADGSFTSSSVIDINKDGIGYVAVVAYFKGADDNPCTAEATCITDASDGTTQCVDTNGDGECFSDIANTHTIIFKKTTDYGLTWSDYFYIPDSVFEHMLANLGFPTYNGGYGYQDPDGCIDPETNQVYDYIFEKLFVLYDFDLRVDSEGNPHFVAGVIPSGGDYIYPSGDERNGFYHFTIDTDQLITPYAPGTPNTGTGWNYAMVAPMSDHWGFQDEAETGFYFIDFPSLVISEDSDDVMYVVSSYPDIRESTKYQLPDNFAIIAGNTTTANPDCTMALDNPLCDSPAANAIYDAYCWDITDTDCYNTDPCDDSYDYPNFSTELNIIKSINGGSTWWTPYQATYTNGGTVLTDTIDEISAHTGNTADNDGLYLMYQIPDYSINTTDTLGSADYYQSVMVGYAKLVEEPTGCAAEAGDVNRDQSIDILDVVLLSNYIATTEIVGSMFTCAMELIDTSDPEINAADLVKLITDYILTDTSASRQLEWAELSVSVPVLKKGKQFNKSIPNKGTVQLKTIGDASAIQLEVSGDYILHQTLSDSGWTTVTGKDRILLYSFSGAPLPNETILSYTGSLNISSALVVGRKGTALRPGILRKSIAVHSTPQTSNTASKKEGFKWIKEPSVIPLSGYLNLEYALAKKGSVTIQLYSNDGQLVSHSTYKPGTQGAKKGLNSVSFLVNYSSTSMNPGSYMLVISVDKAPISRSKLTVSKIKPFIKQKELKAYRPNKVED